MSRAPRVLLALAALSVAGVVSPAPAAAHGGSDDSTNYRSTVTAEARDGLRWRVLDHDVFLELRNRSGREVLVLGYEGEPYLRFAPGDGVYRNERSPARFLNEDRAGRTEPPPAAQAGARPRWRRVSGSDTFRWHDHRVHWMGSRPPGVVQADPTRRRTISEWAVAFRIDGRPAEVTGTLEWLPSRSAFPWLLVAFTATMGSVAVGLLTRPAGSRWPRLARYPAVLLVLAMAGGVVHGIDDVLSATASTRDDVVTVAGTALLAACVVPCVRRAWRGDDAGFGLGAVAGMAVLLVQGLSHTDTFTAPLLVSGLPADVARAVAALSLGAGGAAVVAAGLAERRFGTFFGRTRAAPPVPGGAAP